MNQCFYPDVVATAQHLTDLATELASRGHEVTVLTSDRGYDNPNNRFASREVWNNITIRRIPSLVLGKKTKIRRAINFASFLTICSLHLLVMRRFDVVVALTSPPLISFLASLFVAVKGGRFCFWVMDLNPDEAIAAGWLRDDSFNARVLKRMLKYSLQRADRTIVLDRFMRDRLLKKGIAADRISIVPPWSHDDAVEYSIAGRSAFRLTNKLERKFVVMYSGNHSPCHPLDTLLNAALALEKSEEIVFCFVGGGSEQAKVREFAEQHQLQNVLCLPYQRLDKLSASLSSADLHVVVMGENFAGIVHPCKIYNIMRLGIPTLYIGPEASHVSDIAAKARSANLAVTRHGDTDGVVHQILNAKVQNVVPPTTLRDHSQRFSKHILLPEMIQLIECNPTTDAPLQKAVAQSSVSAQ